MKVPNIPLKYLHIALAILLVSAATIYINRTWTPYEFELGDKLTLVRHDYFTHYSLLDERRHNLMDDVDEIGILPGSYIFKSKEYNIQVMAGMENVIVLDDDEYKALEGSAELWKPWILTDEINDQNTLRFLYKLNIIAIVIILTIIGGKQIKRRMISMEANRNQE